jgi:hypothetical protein
MILGLTFFKALSDEKYRLQSVQKLCTAISWFSISSEVSNHWRNLVSHSASTIKRRCTNRTTWLAILVFLLLVFTKLVVRVKVFIAENTKVMSVAFDSVVAKLIVRLIV